MSQSQQDQFIDEEEENFCPLCVEAYDLSDKSFRPCQCGYKVCQFCYNNIKNNLNGLCPNCRRDYESEEIQWRVISPEEIAAYKAEQAQEAKKKAQARQKEAQKREADQITRKHLAGLRVIQKNLVYVTGLSPTIREDQLLQTLRGDDYFGQYGKIVKIVVSKAKDTPRHQHSVGIYVTFARREDAATCIQSVDGSQNGDRTLRAQYGTTKYCSAYIRGETCNNRSCMFLHEPGEESESFTRQDLSARNVMTTQPSRAHQPVEPSPPPPYPPAPRRQESKEGTVSPTDSAGDGSALPSTASWGNKATHAQGRRASRATTGSGTSPHGSTSTPDPSSSEMTRVEPVASHSQVKESPSEGTDPSGPAGGLIKGPPIPALDRLVERVLDPHFKLAISLSYFSVEDQEIIKSFPPFIDPNGGAKRRERREKEEEQRRKQEDEIQATVQATVAAAEPEEAPEGGSLQLGGEPEGRHPLMGQAQQAIQPPPQMLSGSGLGPRQGLALGDDLSTLNGRGLTPQAQQRYLLQQLKGSSQSNMLNAFSNQAQLSQSQGAGTPGHARQTSRYSFANDSSSASASIKPVANAKLMNQQASMMPQGQSHFNPSSQHQAFGGQFYSGVQGPPPGLKTSGTPPVNGVNMFGQGHGFATGGLGYGANAAGRNANEEMVRNLLRRGDTGSGQMQDAGKREYTFPSFLHQHHHHHPSSSTASSSPAPGLYGGFPYGGPGQPGGGGGGAPGAPPFSAHQDSGSVSSLHQKPQKKKGKKHRHANTSSSGGGGAAVVDVSDPSILQARLHPGGTTAGMVGHGQGQALYGGGQGQGHVFPPSDLARHEFEVDALVNESSDDDPFSAAGRLRATLSPQRSAPTAPPGLPVPAAATNEQPVTTGAGIPSAPVVAPITPAVPVLPGLSGTPAGMEALATKQALGTTPHEPEGKASDAPAGKPAAGSASAQPERKTDSKPDAKGRTTASTMPGVAHARSSSTREAKPVPEPKAGADEGEATALPAGKTTTKSPSRRGTKAETETPKASSPSKAPSSAKPPKPGRLDIPASAATRFPAKEKDHSKAKPAGAPTTTASTGSPVKRTQPKVLRVVQTPKSDPSTSGPTTSAGPGDASSQPSAHTAAPATQPATPASASTPASVVDVASDAASLTSTSVSRPGSPPLGDAQTQQASRIGAISVSARKSKAQKSREKQDKPAATPVEEVVRETKKDDREKQAAVEQAPIVGRKKKTKKEKAKGTATSTAEKTARKSNETAPTVEDATVKMEPKEATKAKEKPKNDNAIPSPVEKSSAPAEPELSTSPSSGLPSQASQQPERATDAKPPTTLTPASILAPLLNAGNIQPSSLQFFKPPTSHHSGARGAAGASIGGASDQLPTPTPAHLAALAAGRPVRLSNPPGPRTLLTPTGACLRALTPDEEARYLDLESRFRARGPGAPLTPDATVTTPAPPSVATAFRPRRDRPAAFLGVPELVPALGGPAEFALHGAAPATSGDADPVARELPTADPDDVDADEAALYVNQMVLPPPTTSSSASAAASAAEASGAAALPVEPPVAGAPRFPFEEITPLTPFMAVGGSAATTAAPGVAARDVPGLFDALPAAAGPTPGVVARAMGVREAESAMLACRKEAEMLEKRLVGLWRRNRKALGV